MMQTKLLAIAIAAFTLSLAVETASPKAVAQKDGAPRVDTPQSQTAILDDHVKEILIAMQHDRNGTVSQQEFIALMRAEFGKLDQEQSGQVNARRLKDSKPYVIPSARYGK